MIQEIKFDCDGIRYKSVQEHADGLCTGCIFRYAETAAKSGCMMDNKKVMGIVFGEECAENNSIFEKDMDINLVPTSKEELYTVEEVIDQVYLDIGTISNFNTKEDCIKYIKRNLLILNDPEYADFVRLTEKFNTLAWGAQ